MRVERDVKDRSAVPFQDIHIVKRTNKSSAASAKIPEAESSIHNNNFF